MAGRIEGDMKKQNQELFFKYNREMSSQNERIINSLNPLTTDEQIVQMILSFYCSIMEHKYGSQNSLSREELNESNWVKVKSVKESQKPFEQIDKNSFKEKLIQFIDVGESKLFQYIPLAQNQEYFSIEKIFNSKEDLNGSILLQLKPFYEQIVALKYLSQQSIPNFNTYMRANDQGISFIQTLIHFKRFAKNFRLELMDRKNSIAFEKGQEKLQKLVNFGFTDLEGELDKLNSELSKISVKVSQAGRKFLHSFAISFLIGFWIEEENLKRHYMKQGVQKVIQGGKKISLKYFNPDQNI